MFSAHRAAAELAELEIAFRVLHQLCDVTDVTAADWHCLDGTRKIVAVKIAQRRLEQVDA